MKAFYVSKIRRTLSYMTKGIFFEGSVLIHNRSYNFVAMFLCRPILIFKADTIVHRRLAGTYRARKAPLRRVEGW